MSLAKSIADFLVSYNDADTLEDLQPAAQMLTDALLEYQQGVGRPAKSATWEKVRKLHAAGKTPTEIREKLGCGYGLIRNALSETPAEKPRSGKSGQQK